MASIIGDMGEDLNHGSHQEDDQDEEPNMDCIELDERVPESSHSSDCVDYNEIQEVCPSMWP